VRAKAWAAAALAVRLDTCRHSCLCLTPRFSPNSELDRRHEAFWYWQKEAEDVRKDAYAECLSRSGLPQKESRLRCRDETDESSFWPELRKSKAFRHVKKIICDHYRAYRAALELSREVLDCNLLFLWLNVHRSGSGEPIHDHPRSRASGILYLSVPAGEPGSPPVSSLVFHDPRTPFGGYDDNAEERDVFAEQNVTLQPRAGLLLLFPSWLTHTVRPQEGGASLLRRPGASLINSTLRTGAERISVAFNVPGQWKETARGSVLEGRRDGGLFVEA